MTLAIRPQLSTEAVLAALEGVTVGAREARQVEFVPDSADDALGWTQHGDADATPRRPRLSPCERPAHALSSAS